MMLLEFFIGCLFGFALVLLSMLRGGPNLALEGSTNKTCISKGCDQRQVIDCENRRVYEQCARCLTEFQYDFQRDLNGKNWIGFASGENECRLCFGWKSVHSKFCNPKGYCDLNPVESLKII